jgi:hypothetical protein
MNPQTATQITLVLQDENDKAFLLECIAKCQKAGKDRKGNPIINIPIDSNTSGLIASILSRATVNTHGMTPDMANTIILDISPSEIRAAADEAANIAPTSTEVPNIRHHQFP